jgi:hypothetical protein
MNYSIERLDHLGIVAGVIKDLKIVELIDGRLGTYEGETLSAGETVDSMIINDLGFSNMPMTLTPLFFEHCPLPLLFDKENVKASDFNRFKLGRVLDRCHSYGTELLFSEISLHVCRQEQVDTRFNSLDTTSFTLSGDYLAKPDEETVAIKLGYSKDHRPDLKQVMLEMIVTQDGGIPLLGKALKGNASDNTVFKERCEIGGRALPLIWVAEEGSANIGFAKQKHLLEQVLAWIPKGAKVMLLADRFYPSADLFRWLVDHDWQYRLRLKGNLLADPGFGDKTTTGKLLPPETVERYLSNVRLFGKNPIMTHIGILHEAGHDESWMIAMNCTPTRAAVLDYGSRWAIEPTFSDFKSRGFDLEDSQLIHADRIDASFESDISTVYYGYQGLQPSTETNRSFG